MAKSIQAFLMEEEGIGVIEVVLILVVLIGLVIIFKKQITDLLNNIFKEINTQSKEVYQDHGMAFTISGEALQDSGQAISDINFYQQGSGQALSDINFHQQGREGREAN